MTWIKLDDQFYTHPKAIAAGRDGRALYLAGLCYASANLTDGLIPVGALPIVAAMAGVKHSTARELADVGLWEATSDGWIIHNYSAHQRTAHDVQSQRDQARERQRKRRGVAQMSQRDNVGSHSVSHATETETETETDNSNLPDSMRLCELLADLIEQNGSKRPKITKRWLTETDRLQTIDARSPVQIENMIRWSQADRFWHANILSMPTLRVRYDQMRLQAKPVKNDDPFGEHAFNQMLRDEMLRAEQ